MQPESREEIPQILECKPFLCDAKWRCHCRRPRLWWISWTLHESAKVKIIDHGSYFEVQALVTKIPMQCWVRKGCTWPMDNNKLLDTFTRVIRRQRPPNDPAGLEYSSPIAQERLEHDDFARQVYMYESTAMVLDKSSSERFLLNAN